MRQPKDLQFLLQDYKGVDKDHLQYWINAQTQLQKVLDKIRIPEMFGDIIDMVSKDIGPYIKEGRVDKVVVYGNKTNNNVISLGLFQKKVLRPDSTLITILKQSFDLLDEHGANSFKINVGVNSDFYMEHLENGLNRRGKIELLYSKFVLNQKLKFAA